MTKESRVTSRGDRDRSWESRVGVRGLGGCWLAMFEVAVGQVPDEDCGIGACMQGSRQHAGAGL